jgi:hypothetical protein
MECTFAWQPVQVRISQPSPPVKCNKNFILSTADRLNRSRQVSQSVMFCILQPEYTCPEYQDILYDQFDFPQPFHCWYPPQIPQKLTGSSRDVYETFTRCSRDTYPWFIHGLSNITPYSILPSVRLASTELFIMIKAG